MMDESIHRAKDYAENLDRPIGYLRRISISKDLASVFRKPILQSYLDKMWNKILIRRELVIDISIVIFLVIISCTFFWYFVVPSPTHTGDIISDLYPAELLSSGQGINIYNPVNEDYKTYGFAPYGNYRTPTELYTNTFPGEISFYALVISIFGYNSFFLVSGFFGGICVASTFFLVKGYTDSRKWGLFGAFILLSMPVFAKWSVDNFSNIIMVTFFLLATCSVFLIRSDRRFFVTGLLLSIAVFIRPDAIILAIPFLILFYFEKSEKMSYVKFLVPLLFVIAILYPVMDYLLYNDALFLGGQCGVTWPLINSGYPNGVRVPWIFNMGFSLDSIGTSTLYFLGSSFAFPLLVPSIVGSYTMGPKYRTYPLFVVSVAVCLILFYGRDTSTYGFFQMDLHSSFLRYMLPLYVILPIGVIGLLLWVKNHLRKWVHLVAIAIVIVLIVASFSIAILFQPYGLIDLNHKEEIILEGKADVLNATGVDDIFISDIYGRKLLFPERQNIFYLPRVPSDIRESETDQIIIQSLDLNISVYLVLSIHDQGSLQMLEYLQEKYNLEYLNLEKVVGVEVFIILGLATQHY